MIRYKSEDDPMKRTTAAVLHDYEYKSYRKAMDRDVIGEIHGIRHGASSSKTRSIEASQHAETTAVHGALGTGRSCVWSRYGVRAKSLER